MSEATFAGLLAAIRRTCWSAVEEDNPEAYAERLEKRVEELRDEIYERHWMYQRLTAILGDGAEDRK